MDKAAWLIVICLALEARAQTLVPGRDALFSKPSLQLRAEPAEAGPSKSAAPTGLQLQKEAEAADRMLQFPTWSSISEPELGDLFELDSPVHRAVYRRLDE